MKSLGRWNRKRMLKTVFAAVIFILSLSLPAGNKTQAATVTTSQGYEVDVSLSRDTDINNYATTDLSIDWKATQGIKAGDHFEVIFSPLDTQDFNLTLGASNETLNLTMDGVNYGTATVTSDTDTHQLKLSFDFTTPSTDLNIHGNVTIKAGWTVTYGNGWSSEKTDKITVNIDGKDKDIPVGIREPETEVPKQSVVNKYVNDAIPVIGRDEPVNPGDVYYTLKWSAAVNMAGLPGASGVPGGETMHNVVLEDEPSGPGHYLALEGASQYSQTLVRIVKDIQMVNGAPTYTYGTLADLPIGGGQASPAPPRENGYYTWSDLISYIGADKLTTVPYGDGDSNHVKSFKLNLGDLPGIGLQFVLYSKLEEGTDSAIPSWRDYFYQSLMNASGESDVYKNTLTLNSSEHTDVPASDKAFSREGYASMNSGNMHLRLHKVDENGVPQSGVLFTLYWNGGSIAAITDSNGDVEFNNFGSGIYKLEETTPLPGYQAMDPVGFTVPSTIDPKYEGGYLDLTDTATFASQGSLSGIAGYFTLNSSGKLEGYNEVINNPIPLNGGFEVTKTDADTGEVLADAEFRLSYKEAGTTYYYPAAGTAWTTDTSLAKVFKTNASGKFSVADLAYRAYQLEEVKAPAGYEISTTMTDIIIQSENMDDYIVTNKKLSAPTGGFEVTKKDEDTGSVLSAAKFHLYFVEAGTKFYFSAAGTGWTIDSAQAKRFETDSDGKFKVEGLPYRTYQLEEIEAPAGYEISTETTDIVIDSENTQLITVTNKKMSDIPEDPEDPVPPVDPTDTEDQEDTDTPVNPEDPEDTNTYTDPGEAKNPESPTPPTSIPAPKTDIKVTLAKQTNLPATGEAAQDTAVVSAAFVLLSAGVLGLIARLKGKRN